MRQRRQENDRQLSKEPPNLIKQRDAFLAAGRFPAEVHILDDEVHRLPREYLETFRRRASRQHARTMQRQQHVESCVHSLVIVNYENGLVSEARLPEVRQ
jgi:hypothetical protein